MDVNKLRIPIFLMVVVPLLIAGCGREKVYRIGVSQCSQDDWRTKMNDEIEREMIVAS